MTVLRCREIVPRMKLETPAKTGDIVGEFEPGTPAKALEELNHQSTTSPLSVSPKAPTQEAVRLGNVGRRSLRLASKLESRLSKGGMGVESFENVSRKRRRSDADENMGYGLNLGASVSGNTGVVRKGDLQVGGSSVKVSDKVNANVGILGDTGEAGVGVTKMVEPKESRMQAELGNSGLNSGRDEKMKKGIRKRKFDIEVELSGSFLVRQDQKQNEKRFLYLQSVKEIVKREENHGSVDGSQGVNSNDGDKLCDNESGPVANGSRRNGYVMNESEANAEGAGNDNANSGKELTGKEKGKGKVVEKDSIFSNIDVVKLNSDAKEVDRSTTGTDTRVETRSYRRKEKGKEKVVDNGLASRSFNAVQYKSICDAEKGNERNGYVMNESEANAEGAENDNANSGKELTGKEKAKGKVVEKDSIFSNIDVVKLNSDAKEVDRSTTGTDTRVETRSYRRKEKGKEKVVDNGLASRSFNAVQYKSICDAEKGNESMASNSSLAEATSSHNAEQIDMDVHAERRVYKERFRDIARRNASRFAHFSAQDDEDDHIADVPANEIPPSDTNGEAEDWPGPFSTARKIIKDRRVNVNLQQNSSSVYKRGGAPIIWMPRKDRQGNFPKQSVPSLQDICTTILVKNADAITSLDCVPDVLRHKLSQLLSDSRRMDSHFFGLLVQGSPSEIRVRDCSWLTEEIFTGIFKWCDIGNLMILQLDQCGRCFPDYILLDALACSPNSLPALTTVSLRAAYRLSDVGLSALVSSAPSLRSINLSQCSLLTSDGICCLAASLGSVLRELYLDDCQGIDAMVILPALLNCQHLEVLSLSGWETVCDDFVSKLLRVRGPTMKELVLADCIKLTDSSVRVIAETCPELRAVDLSNLCKLTDAAIGYLANGCRAIHTLKLCRNSFSDEAVAAYLEICGDSLREFSLSNVEQVDQNTAISLSRHSKNLQYLDLSWCRNLTNEALGLIVDSCASLKVLKVFGCTQITDVFLLGHSNEEVQIIGLKMQPILEHLKEPDTTLGPLRYSSVSL